MNKRQEKENEQKAITKKATKTKPAKKKVAKKSATKKKAQKKTTANSTSNAHVIGPRERYEMIAKMAYYRAEARNFEPGYDVQDWLDCESAINEMLNKS
ncbi:MAG: DUF2934 domain-containing protein [Candidatus Thiodiazotropha sp.]